MKTYIVNKLFLANQTSSTFKVMLTCLFFLVWGCTFLLTDDLENWLIENLLVFLFVPILIYSHKRFKFNAISYLSFFVFLTLHILGSMYAYSSVPWGFHLQSYFHLARNPYDRIVHFSFGFLLAVPLYDLLKHYFNVSGWRKFIMPMEIILSLSAMFELIEWIIGGVLMPGSEKTYVGSQGDPWDAQKDMALALIGAVIAMVLVAMYNHIHEKFKTSLLR